MPIPPDIYAPQLLGAAPAPPERGHAYEIKHDGWRTIAGVAGDRVRLRSRGGHELGDRLPGLRRALARLGREAVIDGEIAVADEDGVTRLPLLEQALGRRSGRDAILFCAFDLLWLDGADLRPRPWIERKAALGALLRDQDPAIVVVEHVEQGGATLFAEACRRGLEGIVSKRLDAPYRPGRGRAWLKTKRVIRGTRFAVVGYRGRDRIEGLLLAEPGPDGALQLAGEVSFGLRALRGRQALPALRSLARPTPPGAIADRAGVTWVEPRLVATVDHLGRTGAGKLRTPVLTDVGVDSV